jgi:hypothetical protein
MPNEQCHNSLAVFGQCFLDTTMNKIGAVIATLGLIAPFWHALLNDYVTNLPTILQTLSCLWIVIQIVFSVHRFVRDRRRRVN